VNLAEDGEASSRRSQNVHPHRQVRVHVDAKITYEADWRKQVATDSKLMSWQLVVTAGRCTPQEFSISCVQLKSV